MLTQYQWRREHLWGRVRSVTWGWDTRNNKVEQDRQCNIETRSRNREKAISVTYFCLCVCMCVCARVGKCMRMRACVWALVWVAWSLTYPE